MSLKTMIAILQVAVQKKINENNALHEICNRKVDLLMNYYHEGFDAALKEIFQLLEETYETIQEEL